MSLISWDTILKSKIDGGLGFRDIQSFNSLFRIYAPPILPNGNLAPYAGGFDPAQITLPLRWAGD